MKNFISKLNIFRLLLNGSRNKKSSTSISTLFVQLENFIHPKNK